ncbi:MAG: hypothetical protein KDA78_14100 [Planctomycetaceae bacterium]|nr:hypothetical protein [Planctomycetaceae bacterium]
MNELERTGQQGDAPVVAILNPARLIAGLWLILLVWSFVRCPVPAVNEPHYLCKARNFIDPAWCERDFFLASSNPHAFYYAVTGPFTQILEFEQVAVLGRAAGLLLVACGWYWLATPILTTTWQVTGSLCLFLLLQAVGNFSGEWLVGGGESKVFSYGLAFLGCGLAVRNRWKLAAVCLGLAIAFHPLVGLWFALAWGATVFCLAARERKLLATLRSLVLPLVILILLALPGLLPALRVLQEPVSAADQFAGNYLQVFFRLGHHLDPMRFSPRAITGYLVLTALVLLMGFKLHKSFGSESSAIRRQFHWLVGIVLFATLFAAAGYAIGWRTMPADQMPGVAWRVKLLKFYPFRLFDLIVPVAASILAVVWISKQEWTDNLNAHSKRALALALLPLLVGLLLPYPDARPSRMKMDIEADWREMCAWIEDQTPAESLHVTPRRGWAFKWFAQRAEYVNFKDCPQESAGILEWNERLRVQSDWFNGSREDELIDSTDLQLLRKLTGAEFLLTWNSLEISSEPEHVNGSFALYRLPESTSADSID